MEDAVDNFSKRSSLAIIFPPCRSVAAVAVAVVLLLLLLLLLCCYCCCW
jgi:hypothetical protein